MDQSGCTPLHHACINAPDGHQSVQVYNYYLLVIELHSAVISISISIIISFSISIIINISISIIISISISIIISISISNWLL